MDEDDMTYKQLEAIMMSGTPTSNIAGGAPTVRYLPNLKGFQFRVTGGGGQSTPTALVTRTNDRVLTPAG